MYFKPSVSNGDWNVIVVKEGNTSLVVKNLKKYTEYSFRISAFTSKGEGNVSESISVSTDEDGKDCNRNELDPSICDIVGFYEPNLMVPTILFRILRASLQEHDAVRTRA